MIHDYWEALVKRLAADIVWGCMCYGASVTSGIRSPSYNIGVKGSLSSWHLDGLAYDVVLDDEKKGEAFIAYFISRGYRVLPTGKKHSEPNRAYHIQYDWPVVACRRVNHLTHLKLLLAEGVKDG